MNINKMMKQLERKVDRIEKAALQGFNEGVQLINADIKRNAPVDKGHLRKGYLVEEGDTKYIKRIKNDVPYADKVEFGTSKQRPQPHVRPAVNRAREELPKRIKDKINKEV